MVIVALMLLFDGGYISPLSKQLSDSTIQYVANSIGIFASVEPNELNQITAELSKRENELDTREAALREREISARDFGGNDSDVSVYILSVILFILTVLIVLNYAMDFIRARKHVL